MKKIMFNDRFGLTQAVLEGRKTMTRRIIKLDATDEEYLDTAFDWDLRESVIIDRYSKYKIGEIVAVAQSYKDAGVSPYFIAEEFEPQVQFTPGWNNKMFVKAWPLPNRIRFTDMKIERLQDISDEDCLSEGIFNTRPTSAMFGWDLDIYYSTPREAFAALIDKVSGKGTWDSNPYVFAYSFELVQYKKGASK